MARLRSERPVPPRLHANLPLDPNLPLIAGGDVNAITIRGDFSAGQLDRLVLEEVHIVNSSFTAADLSFLRLIDVLVEGSDFSGANMEEASLSRVVFKNCRMSGTSIPGSQMRDVSFDEVRLNDVNLRRSTGDLVFFDRVNLQRGDLFAAELARTRFFDCDMTGVDFSQAKLKGARFHGSQLSEIRGGEYLRDIVIDSSQILPLAHRVFAGLNIRIEDERDANELM